MMHQRFEIVRRRLNLSLFAFVTASLCVTTIGVAAVADDPRPSEIAYTTPGSVPTLIRQSGEQRIVHVSDHRLHPRHITLQPNERLGWLSYSGADTRIVFEREVAGAMACHSVVNFEIIDDELRSGIIHPGDTVGFCQLAPGRYRYQVVRKDPDSRARRRLEGVIVVLEKKGSG